MNLPAKTSKNTLRIGEPQLPRFLADNQPIRYVFAGVAVGIAYAVCSWLDPSLRQWTPYALFYLAVFSSIFVGGRGPGVLAGVLSIIAYLSLLEPAERFAPENNLRLVVFALVCLGVGWFDSMRSAQTSAAKQASRELELFVGQVQDYAIFMLDKEGHIRTWNSGAERLFGYSRDEIMGASMSMLLGGAETEKQAAEQMSIARRHGRCSFEARQKRFDGSEFPADVSISLVLDDDGEELGFAKVIFDLTTRRAEELALKRREEHLKSILATVPQGMIVSDEQGTIRSFSATAEKMFGYTQTEMVGQNVRILMPSPDRERHDGFMHNYLATGVARIIGIGRDVYGQRSDGSTFPIHLSIGEAQAGDERLFTGFVQDLSEKLEYEAKVAQLQNELIHVSRLSAMGTMASTLAHELNQPLTTIASYAEAAKVALEREEASLQVLHDAVNEMAAQSLRAGAVVRKLRQFVSRGDLTRSCEDLPNLIEEAAALALLGTAEKGITARYSFDESATPVLVDRIQIQQVLINLLRNAVEAMEGCAEKQLEITTELVDPKTVRVAVSDTGPGLPLDMRDQIFEAFKSQKPSGMGLGLSICRTIIEAHGGKIKVVEREGGGSVFMFTIELFSPSGLTD